MIVSLLIVVLLVPDVTKFNAGPISFERETKIVNLQEGDDCQIITFTKFILLETTLKRGDDLIIKYEICNPNNDPIVVGLGMSIRPTDQVYREIIDTTNDVLVPLTPGIDQYERKFHILEDSEPGVYDLALAIWPSDAGKEDKIHNTKWMKQKFIVK